MPFQRSLFPDAFEVQAAALVALRDLDVGRALDLVARARALDPRLPNLAALDEALHWLRRAIAPPPAMDRVATALLAVGPDCLAGRLTRVGAEFVDEAIARFCAQQDGAGSPFLDPDERVPRALLDLVRGDAASARQELLAILPGRGHRGDLWACLGDACTALQRPDEANPCYVRALLLSACEFDLWRAREPRLFACYATLRQRHDEAGARELLLSSAWLEHLLVIPPANGWLDGQLGRLLAAVPPCPGAAPQRRWRRFGLLLYLDQSASRGEVDLARREEMTALAPELFARYMRECRRREQAETRNG